jgi:hypothetical protein
MYMLDPLRICNIQNARMMKKKLVLFAAMLFTSSLFAQDEPATTNEAKVRRGLKLGLSFANIRVGEGGQNGPDPSAISSRTGIIGGGYLRIRINNELAFQPEALYIGKGWQVKYYHSWFNANYIEIPLNLLYTAYGSRGSTFYIGGGPAPSIILNENFYFGSDLIPKQFDLGINLLVGYEVPIGFSLNFNYNHGLVNFNSISNGPEIKNKYFGVTLGYTF